MGFFDNISSIEYIAAAMIVIIVSGAISFVVLTGEPIIDPVTMEDCRCCMEGQNLSFPNPVEAFYWLEVNSQTDPEWIIIKYHIANECGWNCTIWDKEQEIKMIKRAREIREAGRSAHDN